jgi:hypothetical protein
MDTDGGLLKDDAANERDENDESELVTVEVPVDEEVDGGKSSTGSVDQSDEGAVDDMNSEKKVRGIRNKQKNYKLFASV